MHHGYCDGYSIGVIMDADSEIITMLDVIAVNGAEARDAVDLIRREEQTHGNDIDVLSIDGIGFNAEVLREQLMIGFAVNLKRMVSLTTRKICLDSNQ